MLCCGSGLLSCTVYAGFDEVGAWVVGGGPE